MVLKNPIIYTRVRLPSDSAMSILVSTDDIDDGQLRNVALYAERDAYFVSPKCWVRFAYGLHPSSDGCAFERLVLRWSNVDFGEGPRQPNDFRWVFPDRVISLDDDNCISAQLYLQDGIYIDDISKRVPNEGYLFDLLCDWGMSEDRAIRCCHREWL